MDGSKALEVHRDGHVARVMLCGPGRGNAMGPDFWEELPRVFAALDADAEVRAVVVHGKGAHFSYGLDLMALVGELGPFIQANVSAVKRLELLALIERWQAALDGIDRCRKPVIAAIWGWCIGGGVDMISACDIRICAADAKFSVREARIAIVADVGSLQRLPRIIGEGHARELAFTARDFDAAHAEHIGLVNAVHADADATIAAAVAMARDIAANAPLAVQGAKRVMNWSREHSTRDGLAYVAAWNSAFLQSEDLAEALASFMQKREPDYQGR